MGFGRGVGFSPKVLAEDVSYTITYGGGKAEETETEESPTYALTYGGGRATETLTESNPTYTTAVT